MKMQTISLNGIGGLIGGTVAIGGVLWGLIVAVRQKSWRAIAEQNSAIAQQHRDVAESWKEMATVKDEKIRGLEARVTHLEDDTRQLLRENGDLRRLNLEYQNQISSMRVELAEMRKTMHAKE